MTVVGIVQARAGSSRLPGKVLEPIGGTPMIVKVLDRLARSSTIDDLIVATTDDPSDDALHALLESLGHRVVRGSQFDVLDRFRESIEGYDDSDVVVRVTADCPFIDSEVVDLVVRERAAHGADFAANRLPPPSPRTYPVGLDVEVCTVAALRRASREAVSTHHREHVMPYLYESGRDFTVRILDLDSDLSSYRWTVDTPADLAAVRLLDELAGPEPFGWRRVLEVASEHPGIGIINNSSTQKTVTETDARWAMGEN